VSARAVAKRLPFLKQLATARYFWIRAAPLAPASRLRVAVYQGFPRLAPATIRVELKETAVAPRVRCRTTDIFVLLEVFADRQYQMPVGFRPPQVIVDAGANIGLTSLFFVSRYPEARIVAIEPDDENFELLLANTGQYRNVRALKAALWHEHGNVELHDPGIGKWGLKASPGQSGTADVRTVTMDDLIGEYGRVDLLKMDIEGAERDVLKHSLSWFDSVGALALEIHDVETTDVISVFDDLTREFVRCGERNSVTVVVRPHQLNRG
jgi:FkbM family methyltransferase